MSLEEVALNPEAVLGKRHNGRGDGLGVYISGGRDESSKLPIFLRRMSDIS